MTSPDEASTSVLRSEEQLHIRTQTHPTETVRIEKVVVTETRTITVDVRREELRITHTPVVDGDTPATPDTTHTHTHTHTPIVMVLHEEQLTFIKNVVPVERVTVDVHTVTTDQLINESLRREQVDVTVRHNQT